MKNHLSSKQIKCAEYMAQGKSQIEITALIGVHESTICRWKQDASFCKLLEERTRALVADYAPEQIQTLLSLSRSAMKESVRYQAARELLYMGGFKPVEQIQDLSDIKIRIVKADEPNSTD